MIQGGFVKHCNTKVFLGSVRLGHLQKGIDFSNSRDVVWNERFNLSVEVNFLRLVPLDVFE